MGLLAATLKCFWLVSVCQYHCSHETLGCVRTLTRRQMGFLVNAQMIGITPLLEAFSGIIRMRHYDK